MDVATVDNSYNQLQQQAQQTAQLIQTLAGKLQTAANAGDNNAREWLLDLKEIALGVRDEESQTSNLLQAIHAMIDNHVQQVSAAPVQQAQYQQPMQGYAPMGGGMLQRFLGGGIGRAIATGAGFGIGDELIQNIF
jgi:hypothetical protein